MTLTPPLIFNDENRAPGVHALIIGVSAYDYIKNGTAKPAQEPMLTQSTSSPLGQLVGPAQSARNIADLLISRAAKLTKPLRTLRFLASPGPQEKEKAAAAFDNIQPATAENVANALLAWRTDARRSNDEVTFFYFAGHGSQLSQTNALILLADYLGGRTIFDRTIEVNDIYGGMTVSPAVPTIARTQFYFIDACRVPEAGFGAIRRAATCVPWDVFDTGAAGRKAAPIFFAALPGEPTLTATGQLSTRFGARLLSCLSGTGAEQTGNTTWVVTIGQLARALSKLSLIQNLAAGATIDTFEINGWGQDQTIIHSLDVPPTIPCIFRFNPSDARRGLGLLLDNFTPEPITFPPELKDPHTANIVAGIYRISSVPDRLLPAQPITLAPPAMDITIEQGKISWI